MASMCSTRNLLARVRINEEFSKEVDIKEGVGRAFQSLFIQSRGLETRYQQLWFDFRSVGEYGC